MKLTQNQMDWNDFCETLMLPEYQDRKPVNIYRVQNTKMAMFGRICV